MSYTKMLVGAALATMIATGPATAQNFKGEGRDATKSFPLAEGTAVIEFEHCGEGGFVVLLLDDAGNAVDEVARGNGTFGGSKAIRIPRSGEYLFDIEAPGRWTVRLASMDVAGADTEAARAGAERGRADAGDKGTAGWLARGFAGGLFAGPIGLGYVLSRAEAATELDAQSTADAASAPSLAWAAAYRDSFEDRLQSRRKRSAVIGGIVGTSVFAWVLVNAINLGTDGQSDGLNELGGGSPFIVVPIRF